MTVVGNWDYSFDLGNKRTTYWTEYNSETGTYEDHVDIVEDYWGRAHVSATVKFQFKVVKVVKLRALFDGALEVEYIKNHAAAYNEFYPLGISGLAGDCEVGDIEQIKAKVEAGINLEHEKVNNKLPSISGYKNITPRYSELDSQQTEKLTYSNIIPMTKKKALGLFILLGVYLVAICIGTGIFLLLKGHVHYLLNILICDVAATIVVWLFGVIFKTASMYDPYWSVQTVIFYIGLLIYFNNFNFFTIIPLIALAIYSVRLTGNFIMGFHDLTYVDWRYTMLKEKSGKLFQLVNLFGICMFPTLVVYGASLPIFVYASLTEFSYLDMIGSIIIMGGVFLEFIADWQMKIFIKYRTSKNLVIDYGLWKYSRHPNYLGEIAIWFGVALVLMIHNPTYWYFIFGAVINLLMFLFISIPMEEKHMLEYKPALKEYIKTTSMLLLLPRRKVNKKQRLFIFKYLSTLGFNFIINVQCVLILEHEKENYSYHIVNYISCRNVCWRVVLFR